MAKKNSLESESKGSGPKKKNLSSDETEVCVQENMESKVRKKRKKTDIEDDATLLIPEISVKADNTKEKKIKKRKQTKKKRKNEERTEIAEPPTDPVATRAQEELEGEEDLSPEEQRIMERKMKKILKKENRLKAEGTVEQVEASKPIAPQQALDYLTCWAENRKQWKFQKTRQTWLLQHMFDSEKIPDESFSALLMYLEGLRGAARDTTVQKAEALVRELGERTEEDDAQQRVHRAREVIQLLS